MVGSVPGRGYSGNGVFRLVKPGRSLCLKLFADARAADREWSVLVELERQAVSCVAAPVDRVANAIVMTWVDGETLGNHSLTPDQVDAFALALVEFGSTPTQAFPSASNYTNHLVGQARRSWNALLSSTRFVEEFHDLGSPIETLLDSSETADLLHEGETWLGRGDPNLANAIWHGGAITFVDFEHSGLNERAIELADLAEHPQSHSCDVRAWDRLWDALDLPQSERQRITAARRLFAVHWLSLFLTDDFARRMNPPERAFTQAARLRRLLDPTG